MKLSNAVQATPEIMRISTASSTLHLPPGDWKTVFDCLCDHFPAIDAEQWRDRFQRGRVLDRDGCVMSIDETYRVGLCVLYYREVSDEKPVPFNETILHLDPDLVVADKPHFLPVTPAGSYVEQTLLHRLSVSLDNPHLVPLHRIDRGTAGLVLFSANPASRARYQAMFGERTITKTYEALAPALPGARFPLTRATRIVRGEPFFRMCEVAGEPNSETRIAVLEQSGEVWRYALSPITGKKHQLRVHMAAIGAPILYDPFYPELREEAPDDYARPLKLLARALAFIDPLTGARRQFESQLAL